jgi:hypothetical protein
MLYALLIRELHDFGIASPLGSGLDNDGSRQK